MLTLTTIAPYFSFVDVVRAPSIKSFRLLVAQINLHFSFFLIFFSSILCDYKLVFCELLLELILSEMEVPNIPLCPTLQGFPTVQSCTFSISN